MLLALLACSEPFDRGTTREARPRRDVDTSVDTGDTGADTAAPARPLELCINELMPDNESAATDETYAYADWIELHNPGEVALDLDGWTVTDFRLEPDKHALDGLTLAPGGYLVLWADALPELGPAHADFKLDDGGGEVAVYAPDGRGSIVTYGPMAADFSLARVPDCCEGDGCLAYDFRGSPGASNVDPVYEDVTLLATGGTWKYWDAGANPGAGWNDVGFDDSAWPSGTAPLGYGDAHLVTTVGYGGVDATKHITTWFRTTFDAPGGAISTLTLSLLRDDGAVVYLNGVEVARDNLPEGELTDATLASASVGAANETAYWTFTLDPTVLVGGPNTLAVELHQSAADSSDLGFDAGLVGQIQTN